MHIIGIFHPIKSKDPMAHFIVTEAADWNWKKKLINYEWIQLNWIRIYRGSGPFFLHWTALKDPSTSHLGFHWLLMSSLWRQLYFESSTTKLWYYYYIILLYLILLGSFITGLAAIAVNGAQPAAFRLNELTLIY